MSKSGNSLKVWMSRNAKAVAIIVSLGMLVLAGNLDSPALWLVVPAWLVLGLLTVLGFISLNDEDPYKIGFYVLLLPSSVLLALRTPMVRIWNLLEVPSGSNLWGVVSNRPLLAFGLIYFALVAGILSGKIREMDARAKQSREEWSQSYEYRRVKLEELEREIEQRRVKLVELDREIERK
jgi:hypothetical protein